MEEAKFWEMFWNDLAEEVVTCDKCPYKEECPNIEGEYICGEVLRMKYDAFKEGEDEV